MKLERCNKFYDDLFVNGLIAPIWREALNLLENELNDSVNKENYLILFTIMFSLMDDGNICMSLDKSVLLNKWKLKLEGKKILLSEENTLKESEYNDALNTSTDVINQSLQDLNAGNLPEVVGDSKLFEIENGWIYLRKNNVARKILKDAIERLFNKPPVPAKAFDYTDCLNTSEFDLYDNQREVVTKGLERNLFITGGPGCGKTTSIFYLLVGLLMNKDYQRIYLLAPSGKASDQMTSSILGEKKSVRADFYSNHQALIDRIFKLESSTIHSALGVDFDTGAFKHNEKKQFESNSIFIIDEASMIDVCLFASLLSAIPDDARIFIMGDKNQLPSVDAGSVFGELLGNKSPLDKDNIVVLEQTKRFAENSEVFALAHAINNGTDLPALIWNNKKLEPKSKPADGVNPVYCFNNPRLDSEGKPLDENITIAESIRAFAEYYYVGIQKNCVDLEESPADPKKYYTNIYESAVGNACILSAENNGVRGVKNINKFVKSCGIFDKNIPCSFDGFYPGELMIINKNNSLLDLSNGNCGVLVTFKNDSTIYFMIKKDSKKIKKSTKEPGVIFKLGDCIFYPLTKIPKKDISDAYAITIHKSQGSGYNNILVILPTKKGHPLLNRQIIYTAITRTKGNTYILSNQDMLNCAKETLLTRDTNLK